MPGCSGVHPHPGSRIVRHPPRCGMHLCVVGRTGLLDAGRVVLAVVPAGQGIVGRREAGLPLARPMPVSEPAGNPVSQPPNIHTATDATRQ